MARSHEIQVSETIAPVRLRVDKWTACGAGLETRADWIAWVRGTDAAEPGRLAVTLPPLLRRRVTALGQMAFRAACNLAVPENTRFIFCSRHGEFQRTLKILTALAASEAVSPAEFSLSVHNALAGLLSIAWRNTVGHTTIAAGVYSFGSALIEAASCLLECPDQAVLLVYADDRLPEPYDEIADSDESCVAIAMLLTSPRPNASEVILELTPGKECRMGSATGQALDFIRFLLTEEPEHGPVSERPQWRLRRA